jgi:DNA modification methylase
VTITFLTGDCRDVLPTLADASVQCVVCSPPYYALRSYLPDGHADKHREIGSEPTPDAFVATLVEVFREVRRVLRDDGTCWVNLGDSYSGGKTGRTDQDRNSRNMDGRNTANASLTGQPDGWQRPVAPGYKPKDLLMMPARVALALQADGWWLRSDIIWHKPNPMPESCRDRPTSAHEHVFLLTKKPSYYFDNDAIREPQSEGTIERFGNGNAPRKPGIKQGGSDRKTLSFDQATPDAILPNGRSCRNVWTIATHAYSAAHFATYPPELVERCIRAGTSEKGCCPQCGAPWYRVTEGNGAATGKSYNDHSLDAVAGMSQPSPNKKGGSEWRKAQAADPIRTTGWSPSCQCNAEVVPCTVLDPFSGAGTTALVADRLQRNAIAIDLSHEYRDMAAARIAEDAGMFADIGTATLDESYDRPMRDLFANAAD